MSILLITSTIMIIAIASNIEITRMLKREDWQQKVTINLTVSILLIIII
jgi:hypothetical protein